MENSLKIIKLDSTPSRVIIVVIAVVCLALTHFSAKWHFANGVAPTFDRTQPESPMVANWLTEVAPGDPSVRLAAAVTFERTFDMNDLDRSMREYAEATAASPNNYLLWLGLARSRNLNGDTAGAETAFKRSLDLAPNYAAVQWAYGNFLVRQGSTGEGFTLMAKAASANPEYAASAAVTALQIFDGDVRKALVELGETDATNAALQVALIKAERFEDAVEAWSRISAEGKQGKYKQTTDKLAADLTAAKRFALASRVYAAISGGEAPALGRIANGGFESEVKMREAPMFTWQIADGGSPQVGLSESQVHGGKYALVVVFNSFETTAFRSVSQMVLTEPGATYELTGFYRSDVKTASSLRWEIADAATTGSIARTDGLPITSAWASFSVKFTAPAASEAVIVRFTRDGCAGASCPTNGTITFDDLAIRKL